MVQKSTAGAPSQRQLRVGELVRHALSDILARQEARDPDLDGLVITVPEVRMSPDLKVATALVMPLGGRSTDKALAALTRSRARLKGLVARRVNLKFAPELRFILDTRFEDDDRISALLRTPAAPGEGDGDLEPDDER